MSILTCIIIALAVGAAVVAGEFLLRRLNISVKVTRIALASLMIGVSLIFYIYDFEAVHHVVGCNINTPFNDLFDRNLQQNEIYIRTIAGILMVWFTYASIFTTLMSEFMDYPVLRNVTRFFALPIFIIDLALYKILAVSIVGAKALTAFDIRMVLIPIAIGLAIGLIISRGMSDATEGRLIPPTRKELVKLAYTLPAILLVIMPGSVAYALLGDVLKIGIQVRDLSFAHRVVMYFALIVPYLIYRALRDKPQKEKDHVMIFIAFACLWVYLRCETFGHLQNPVNWPLHLCNTAMFLIPLCLAFRWNSLFYFTLFVNVLGAAFAILMPNYSESLNSLHFEVVRFWQNHYIAFFMPVLAMALKMFERPKLKQFGQSLVGFVGYFIAMLFANAWISNYDSGVDFFFLNSDFIPKKLGSWAMHTRDFIVTFDIGDLTFQFYPIYQTLFFIVFVAVSAAVWFLFEILFTSWDAAEDRRLRERDYKNMQKELKEYLGGRSIHQPICGDSSPHMVLKHFRKRYGKNKHYSVNDVSFEVRGGEIFGFLGPNGAGKSTIIKSVVGIQTITEGDIEICGFSVNMQPVQAKKELGFVPDHYALYENLTGREYLNYIADLYEVGEEYRNETIEKYVKLFQLTGSFDNQMKTYSHGMKQKITIMAALVHNPKVWILDEPLTGLDPTSIHEVKECMKEHAAKGNIVFFSSHIIDVVEKICDKIAIIKKGKLRAVAKVSELEARGIDLEQFYLDIIYGDDSDMNVKLIGVDEKEAGICPDADEKAQIAPVCREVAEA